MLGGVVMSADQNTTATSPCPTCNDDGIVHDMEGNILGTSDCVPEWFLSNVSIGRHRLTWREVAERQETELHRLRSFAQTLSDLDRCEHGRHEGDVCSACGGPSLGNPFIGSQDGRAAYEVVPRQIGFTMSGTPIVVPERAHAHDPDAWSPSGSSGDDR